MTCEIFSLDLVELEKHASYGMPSYENEDEYERGFFDVLTTLARVYCYTTQEFWSWY